MDSVTWADALAFVRKLNTLEKTRVYRLPTEFEWEYAARAGADREVANYREYAWTGENNKPVSHAVAGKKPVLLNFSTVNVNGAANQFNAQFRAPEFINYTNGRMVLVNLILTGPKGWEKTHAADVTKAKGIAQQFGASGVPTVLIVDSTGRKLGQLTSGGTSEAFLQRLDAITKLGMVAFTGAGLTPTPPPALNRSAP